MTRLHDPWSSGAFAADGRIKPSACLPEGDKDALNVP